MAIKIRLKNAAEETLWPETDYSVLQSVPALISYLGNAQEKKTGTYNFTLEYGKTYLILADDATKISIAGKTLRGSFFITNYSTKPKQTTLGISGPRSATVSLWSGGTEAVTGTISLGEYVSDNSTEPYNVNITSTLGSFDVFQIVRS